MPVPGRAAGSTLSSAVAMPPEHGAAFTSVWSRSFSILFHGLAVASTLSSAAAQPPESGAVVCLAITSCAICLGLLAVEVVLDEPLDEIVMAIVLDELIDEIEIRVVLDEHLNAAISPHVTMLPMEPTAMPSASPSSFTRPSFAWVPSPAWASAFVMSAVYRSNSTC